LPAIDRTGQSDIVCGGVAAARWWRRFGGQTAQRSSGRNVAPLSNAAAND